MKTFYALLVSLLLMPQAIAASSAVVEGVQMPAWIQRGGAKLPLTIGMQLKNLDQINTGANSRVLLKMAEGSLVKLGENATFNLDRIEQKKENIFTASLGVLKGAFRFTTDALAKARKRDINIRVATVTAGIRGTDFWGKAATDRDIVCLIEGHIQVQRDNELVIEMKDPLSFYVAPKIPKVDANAPAGATPKLPPAKLGPVTREQLEKWAIEVDIASGEGAVKKGGKWKVNLATSADLDEALSVYGQLRANGYAAEIHPVLKNEKRFYSILIFNLPNKDEAQALANKLKGQMGITKPVAMK